MDPEVTTRNMSEWNADENPYEILGLNVEATKDEQRKVSRAEEKVTLHFMFQSFQSFATAMFSDVRIPSL